MKRHGGTLTEYDEVRKAKLESHTFAIGQPYFILETEDRSVVVREAEEGEGKVGQRVYPSRETLLCDPAMVKHESLYVCQQHEVTKC